VKDVIVEGLIFVDGEFERGKFSITRGKFVDGIKGADYRGTLLKAPINLHVHTADSFIREEPRGSLPEVVGPNGLKWKMLRSANLSEMKSGMRQSIAFMRKRGTAAFFDFREPTNLSDHISTGKEGITEIVLTRPQEEKDVEPLVKMSSGFGLSSIDDNDFSWLLHLSKKAKESGKLFAIHYSENVREDIGKLIKLRPDFAVHCIESTNEDIATLRKNRIPVTITPRSNIFYGKRPDYARFLEGGIRVMMGTDNVFVTEPDMWQEGEFLYRYQRGFHRISPEDILKIMIENPRAFMREKKIAMREEMYVLYTGIELTPYQIITKPNSYRRRILVTGKNG